MSHSPRSSNPALQGAPEPSHPTHHEEASSLPASSAQPSLLTVGTIRPLAQGRLPARLPLTDQQVCGVAHHQSLARASPACRSCLDRSVCVWHSCSSDAGRVSGGRQGSKQSSNSRQFRRLQNPGGHRGPSGCCGHRCRGQAHRRRYRCPGRVHVTRKHGPAVYLAANIAPARRSTTRKSSCENGNRGRATAFVIAPT